MIRYFGGIVGLMLAAAVGSANPLDDRADDRGIFFERFRCPIVERLERIKSTGDLAKPNDRFLTVGPKSRPDHYVQCIFFDNDTRLLCEAASGYYERPNRSQLLDEALAALQALGFGMDDSHGNFMTRLDAEQADGLTKAAELMLSALYDAYGSHRATTLEFLRR